MEHVPYVVFKDMQESSCKTLADRFKRFVVQRRKSMKVTSRASEITEKYDEKEMLVHDLILEMNEKQETIEAEKDEEAAAEKQLVSA
ncbi:unnamed protein product [Agarophyton chilense]